MIQPVRIGAPVLVEGYASLFGVEDLAGDVVRAGAFTRTLARHGARTGARGGEIRMLLAHEDRRIAGRWTTMREDGRGLFVRGLVEAGTPAGRAAQALVAKQGMDGLSIGFIAREWRPRTGHGGGHGRELIEIDLREVSLVASPMLPGARFRVVGGQDMRFAA